MLGARFGLRGDAMGRGEKRRGRRSRGDGKGRKVGKEGGGKVGKKKVLRF